MNTEDDLCELYVNSEQTLQKLLSDIAEITGGEEHRYAVSTSFGEIDVRPNEDFNRKKAKSSFLYFSYLVTVENDFSISHEEYCKQVVGLVGHLKRRGYAEIVPACHFEELF